MTSDALLLIGREAIDGLDVLEGHADRLVRRGVADDVLTATYETEPARELRAQLRDIDADRVYALPMCVAHDHDTIRVLPGALSYLAGEVHYCEPIGRSPAVTDAIARRAADRLPPAEDVALVLVGFGSSSKPYHRQMAEHHAARIREGSDYGEVVTCYLLQNPAVECVRYSYSGERAVAVPLFVARSEATAREIPEKLELDRGGIEYADPFGDDPRITDAIHAEVEKQRVLAVGGPASESFESQLTRNRHPVAADGDGRPR